MCEMSTSNFVAKSVTLLAKSAPLTIKLAKGIRILINPLKKVRILAGFWDSLIDQDKLKLLVFLLQEKLKFLFLRTLTN